MDPEIKNARGKTFENLYAVLVFVGIQQVNMSNKNLAHCILLINYYIIGVILSKYFSHIL